MIGARLSNRLQDERYAVGVIVGGAGALVAAVGLVAHFRSPGPNWLLVVSAGAPYLMLGAPVALLALLVGREWIGALVALALTATVVGVQAPLYVAATPPSPARRLVVMTANLKLGGAAARSVVSAVRRDGVEVLMLQELTPQEQTNLARAGLDRLLPHHVADARAQSAGTGLWSRYPLRAATRRTDLSFGFVTARVSLPGGVEPLVGALHLHGPFRDSATWHRDIRHLRTVLPTLAGGHGIGVLGGDFNATPDVHQFRELLTAGWADGAAQAGAGMTRTFPSGIGLPLFALDHVLTRRAVARTASTVYLAGSDHRALLVSVAIPLSPSHGAQ